MKRLISWLLALTLICGLLPMSVFAAVDVETGTESDDFEVDMWELQAGGSEANAINLATVAPTGPGSTFQATVPAGKTIYYVGAAQYANLVAFVDGEAAVTLSTADDMLVHMSITNDTDAEKTYSIELNYPLGSMDNPEVITSVESITANISGEPYYYKYVATADGILSLVADATVTDAEGNVTYVNASVEVTNNVSGTQAQAHEYEVLSVAAGDDVIIVVAAYDAEDPYTVLDGATVAITGALSGSAEVVDYEFLSSLESGFKGQGNVRVTAGNTVYLSAGNCAGMILTVNNAANISIDNNGTVYTADENGVITFTVAGSFWMGASLNITNTASEGIASVKLNLAWPAGAQANPIELNVSKEAAASATASVPESGSVFYNVTAAEDGYIKFVSDSAVASHNVDGNSYDATSITKVTAGQVIEVVVGTSDWSAADVAFTITYLTDEEAAEADEAEAVAAQIKALSSWNDDYTVKTYAPKEDVEAARAAYDALSDTQKQIVGETYNDLVNAENHYAVAEVEAMIDAIGEVTLESEEAIVAARTAYEALNASAKYSVTNLETLEAAEAALEELKTPKCEHTNTTTTNTATCTEAGVETVVCNDCGETVSTTDVAALDHDYTGENGACVRCGEYQVDETLVFYNKAMLLGADIRGIFQVRKIKATSPYESFKVIVEKGGVETELELVATSDKTNYTTYGYALTVPAKEMADVVNAQIIGIKADGTYCVSNPDTWSIKIGTIALMDTYSAKTDEASVNKMKLCANMLNYGAEAQKKFSYNLDNLATDGLSDEYAAYIITTTPEMETIAKTDDTGATAPLKDIVFNLAARVQVLPRFTVAKTDAKEDYKAVINQTHIAPDGTETVYETKIIEGADCLKSGSTFAVYIDYLATKELRDVMTITLYKGDEAVSATHTFSAESVLYGLMDSYPTLIPALMNFCDCARAVFG